MLMDKVVKPGMMVTQGPKSIALVVYFEIYAIGASLCGGGGDIRGGPPHPRQHLQCLLLVMTVEHPHAGAWRAETQEKTGGECLQT